MKWQIKAGGLAVAFAVFVAIFMLADRYVLCFAESNATFFYDSLFIGATLGCAGGVGKLIAAFIVQFFALPVLGIILYAAVLTLLVWMTAKLLAHYCGSDILMPLSILPALMLCLVQFDNILEIQAVVGFIAVAVALVCVPDEGNVLLTIMLDILLTVLLYFGFGAVAAVYVAVRILKNLCAFLCHKNVACLGSLLMLAVLPLSAWLSLRAGLVGTWARALTPDGYSILNNKLDFAAWMPWITFGASALLAIILGSVKPSGKRLFIGLVIGAQAVALVACGLFCGKRQVLESEEFFKKLDHWAVTEQWDMIIGACNKHKQMNNTVYLNYVNLALAQKGQLIDKVFAYPTHNEEGLTIKPQRMSQTSAMLSDIYYACGQLAVAQRHAFEANCAMGNYSPRMLKTLVMTNLAFGADDVADKYLCLLERTIFYRKWAVDVRTGKSRRLNMDRKCARVENELTGFYGDMWELGEVLKVCPENYVAAQYLIARTLVNRDLDRFKYSIQTLLETGSLKMPLPMNCQMAIVAYASNDQAELDRYQIPESLKGQFMLFQTNRNRFQKTFWSYCFNKTSK